MILYQNFAHLNAQMNTLEARSIPKVFKVKTTGVRGLASSSVAAGIQLLPTNHQVAEIHNNISGGLTYAQTKTN